MFLTQIKPDSCFFERSGTVIDYLDRSPNKSSETDRLDEWAMPTPDDSQIDLEQQVLNGSPQPGEDCTTNPAPGTPALKRPQAFGGFASTMTKAYLGLIVRELALSAIEPQALQSRDSQRRFDRFTHRTPIGSDS